MPFEGLPPDADLVLVQNVPPSVLGSLIPTREGESPQSKIMVLPQVREVAAPEAVAEVYRRYRLLGKFAVAWLEPPADISVQRCAQVFPVVSWEYVTTHSPGRDDFWPIWVDSVQGAAVRFVFLEALRPGRVTLSMEERPALGVATVVFRQDTIELRCIAAKLRSFRDHINRSLGLEADEQRFVAVRSNDDARLLKEALGGRFYRARAKMDASHQFDIVDVAAQADVDLAASPKWREYEAGQGRGRYIEFPYPTETVADRNVIRVAQRDVTISFVTQATEDAVRRVREAVLEHGVRT